MNSIPRRPFLDSAVILMLGEVVPMLIADTSLAVTACLCCSETNLFCLARCRPGKATPLVMDSRRMSFKLPCDLGTKVTLCCSVLCIAWG